MTWRTLPPDAGLAEVARLLDVAAGEDDAITQLDSCVARLHEVQAAKGSLQQYTAVELAEALELRRDRGTAGASR